MTAATPSDILLCLLILILALGALGVANPFRGVIMFIVFGLVMALSWTRLQAPDLALAEAALGAGVIGALFLVVLRRQREEDASLIRQRLRVTFVTVVSGLLLTIFMFYLGAMGVFSAWQIPGKGLIGPVYEFLPSTGVSNPVTAVILNYRVYDTFLEIGVLYLVMISVFALQPEGESNISSVGQDDRMLRFYARGIVPLMVLAAGYLLWAGAFRPGGAFQAGAMLGGAGILLHLSRPAMLLDMRGSAIRLVLVAGFLSFTILGAFTMLFGLNFLQWPSHLAKHAILIVEAASTLSIGLTLMGLYAGVEGRLISSVNRSSGEKD